MPMKAWKYFSETIEKENQFSRVDFRARWLVKTGWKGSSRDWRNLSGQKNVSQSPYVQALKLSLLWIKWVWLSPILFKLAHQNGKAVRPSQNLYDKVQKKGILRRRPDLFGTIELPKGTKNAFGMWDKWGPRGNAYKEQKISNCKFTSASSFPFRLRRGKNAGLAEIPEARKRRQNES